MQAYLFLFLLLAAGWVVQNKSLIYSVIFLLMIKTFLHSEKLFAFIEDKGINLGVTVITVAVLTPIATGEIGFKDLLDAFKSPYAWIAMGSGVLVALLAKNGVVLLEQDPHLTTALVLGMIFAITFLKGVAVGPLIGAGIAWVVMKVFGLV
mgnify:FL=1